MKFVLCPRCELNYITENEKYCKVCLREMKGDAPRDEIELCSVCNEAPALPGRDVCLFCLKEMSGQDNRDDDTEQEHVDTASIGGMDSVSTMDEIIPEIDEDIHSQEYGEIENELSLESVREDEENEQDDEDEDEDEDNR